MQRSPEAVNHEVRLRAAAWARRLVEWHGESAEAVVRATLRRDDLTDRERLAARFTRDALADLRRTQGFARATRSPAFVWRFRWPFLFRSNVAPGGHLPHH